MADLQEPKEPKDVQTKSSSAADEGKATATPVNQAPKLTAAEIAEANDEAVKRGWYYLDTSGEEQGPFTSKEMYGWWTYGCFAPDLQVRRVDESDFSNLSSRKEILTPTTSNESAMANFHKLQHEAAVASLASQGGLVDPSSNQKAMFNVVTGRFSGTTDETWWQKVGLPEDRAGRQMAAYFDVDAYQEQMRESKRQKIDESGKSAPKVSKKMLEYFKKKKEDKKRKRMLMM